MLEVRSQLSGQSIMTRLLIVSQIGNTTRRQGLHRKEQERSMIIAAKGSRDPFTQQG